MRELPELRTSARTELVRKKELNDDMIFLGGTMLAMMVIFAVMFFVLRAEGVVLPLWTFFGVELFLLFYIFLNAFSIKISLPGYKVYEIQVVDTVYTGNDISEDRFPNRIKDVDGVWLLCYSNYLFKKFSVGQTYRVVVHRGRIKAIYDEI